MIHRSPSSSLFPYTTLFRSLVEGIVENEELHTEKISRDELILVVSHDHPWNQKQEIEIADIASEKMIWREEDRKSTRLNSSHVSISYAVFCLKKKITNG